MKNFKKYLSVFLVMALIVCMCFTAVEFLSAEESENLVIPDNTVYSDSFSDTSLNSAWTAQQDTASVENGNLVLAKNNNVRSAVYLNGADYVKTEQRAYAEYTIGDDKTQAVAVWCRFASLGQGSQVKGYYVSYNNGTNGRAGIYKWVNGGNYDTVTSDNRIATFGMNLNIASGTRVRVELVCTGSNPTLLTAKLYTYNTSDESWNVLAQTQVVDDTEALQSAGTVAIANETSGNTEVEDFCYTSTDGTTGNYYLDNGSATTTGKTFGQVVVLDPDKTYVLSAAYDCTEATAYDSLWVAFSNNYGQGTVDATTRPLYQLSDSVQTTSNGHYVRTAQFKLNDSATWPGYSPDVTPATPKDSETLYWGLPNSTENPMTLGVRTLIGIRLNGSNSAKYTDFRLYEADDVNKTNLLVNSDFKMGLYGWYDSFSSKYTDYPVCEEGETVSANGYIALKSTTKSDYSFKFGPNSAVTTQGSTTDVFVKEENLISGKYSFEYPTQFSGFTDGANSVVTLGSTTTQWPLTLTYDLGSTSSVEQIIITSDASNYAGGTTRLGEYEIYISETRDDLYTQSNLVAYYNPSKSLYGANKTAVDTFNFYEGCSAVGKYFGIKVLTPNEGHDNALRVNEIEVKGTKLLPDFTYTTDIVTTDYQFDSSENIIAGKYTVEYPTVFSGFTDSVNTLISCGSNSTTWPVTLTYKLDGYYTISQILIGSDASSYTSNNIAGKRRLGEYEIYVSNSQDTLYNAENLKVSVDPVDASIGASKIVLDNISFGEYQVTGKFLGIKIISPNTGNDNTASISEIHVKGEQHYVNVSCSVGGNVSQDGDVVLGYGKITKIDITPDTNYKISDVYVDGESVGAVSQYSFLGGVHTLYAEFCHICDVNYDGFANDNDYKFLKGCLLNLNNGEEKYTDTNADRQTDICDLVALSENMQNTKSPEPQYKIESYFRGDINDSTNQFRRYVVDIYLENAQCSSGSLKLNVDGDILYYLGYVPVDNIDVTIEDNTAHTYTDTAGYQWFKTSDIEIKWESEEALDTVKERQKIVRVMLCFGQYAMGYDVIEQRTPQQIISPFADYAHLAGEQAASVLSNRYKGIKGIDDDSKKSNISSTVNRNIDEEEVLCRFGIMSDSHVGVRYNWENYDWLSNTFDNFADIHSQTPLDFIVSLGDNIDDGYEETYQTDYSQYLELIKGLTICDPENPLNSSSDYIPHYELCGNHDPIGGSTDENGNLKIRFFKNNLWYTESENGTVAHIALFTKYGGYPLYDYAYSGSYDSYKSYGIVTDEMVEFFDESLKAAKQKGAKHIIVYNHFGISQELTAPILPETGLEKISNLCEEYGVKLYFSGHEHNRNYSQRIYGSLYNYDCSMTSMRHAVVEITENCARITIYNSSDNTVYRQDVITLS